MNGLNGTTVGIIGLGQIGGSLAGALRESGTDIKLIGFDRESALLDEALNRSIVDAVARSITEAIRLSDIVVLALPIRAIIEIISGQAELLSEKSLVTDVGSVMTDIVRVARSASLRNFVSGHPLAGSEKRGHEGWDSELFRGAQYFTTSTDDTAPEAEALLRDLVSALDARATEVDCETHDLAFATTSNLVHVLAYELRRAHEALADKAPDPELFAGPSFRAATRVADSDPEMVFQMLWHNRQHLAGAIGRLVGELTEVQKALTEDRPDPIRRLLGGV
jgi:prephenate dehydrogenase